MVRVSGMLWAKHGYKVLARDLGNVDRLDGELNAMAGDLASGIIDLCSQYREAHKDQYAVDELNEIVGKALRRAETLERTIRS